MVYKRNKRSYCCCLVGCCFQDILKNLESRFFFTLFISCLVGCCFQDLFKNLESRFFFMLFISCLVGCCFQDLFKNLESRFFFMLFISCLVGCCFQDLFKNLESRFFFMLFISCLVGCCFQDLLKNLESRFFFMLFISFQVVHWYSNAYIVTAWKNSFFILSDFCMIDNLSHLSYLYTDIIFNRWDIAAWVCEQLHVCWLIGLIWLVSFQCQTMNWSLMTESIIVYLDVSVSTESSLMEI